jgi:hypothetical protein
MVMNFLRGYGIFLVGILVPAIAGALWLPLLSVGGADTAEAAVTVDMLTDYPQEQPLLDASLAQLTLKASVDGEPLRSGHLAVKITAPPTPWLLPTLFPTVAGTTLLQLTSVLEGGTFQMEYFFPMPGDYIVDVDVTRDVDGQAMQPESFLYHLPVQANSASTRRAWLFRIGLCALGGIAGVGYAHVAHRRNTRRTRAITTCGAFVLGGLLWVTGALAFAHHGAGKFVFPKRPEVIHGDDGWALEVRPTPVQAVIGELLDLHVRLTHGGQVFSGMIAVAIDLYNFQDDHTVLRTSLLAPNGLTSQRIQFVARALHTCSITVRPLSGGSGTPETLPSLTSVIGIEAAARSLPTSVKLQVIGLMLGMVGSGVAGGFMLASGVRKVWLRESAMSIR